MNLVIKKKKYFKKFNKKGLTKSIPYGIIIIEIKKEVKIMSKKTILVTILVIAIAVGCGKLGEWHVLREQQITTTETGYRVDFNGHYWTYE